VGLKSVSGIVNWQHPNQSRGERSLAAATGTAGLGALGAVGLNAIQQGAQIKDGMLAPATGQPKTDIDFGAMMQNGLTGAVAVPVAVVGATALPVIAGGATIFGADVSGYNTINLAMQGHGWSAAAEGLNFGMAGCNRGSTQAISGDKPGGIADLQKAVELAQAQGDKQLAESAWQSLRTLQP
jgi:hypothetical protein